MKCSVVIYLLAAVADIGTTPHFARGAPTPGHLSGRGEQDLDPSYLHYNAARDGTDDSLAMTGVAGQLSVQSAEYNTTSTSTIAGLVLQAINDTLSGENYTSFALGASGSQASEVYMTPYGLSLAGSPDATPSSNSTPASTVIQGIIFHPQTVNGTTLLPVAFQLPWFNATSGESTVICASFPLDSESSASSFRLLPCLGVANGTIPDGWSQWYWYNPQTQVIRPNGPAASEDAASSVDSASPPTNTSAIPAGAELMAQAFAQAEAAAMASNSTSPAPMAAPTTTDGIVTLVKTTEESYTTVVQMAFQVVDGNGTSPAGNCSNATTPTVTSPQSTGGAFTTTPITLTFGREQVYTVTETGDMTGIPTAMPTATTSGSLAVYEQLPTALLAVIIAIPTPNFAAITGSGSGTATGTSPSSPANTGATLNNVVIKFTPDSSVASDSLANGTYTLNPMMVAEVPEIVSSSSIAPGTASATPPAITQGGSNAGAGSAVRRDLDAASDVGVGPSQVSPYEMMFMY